MAYQTSKRLWEVSGHLSGLKFCFWMKNNGKMAENWGNLKNFELAKDATMLTIDFEH